MVGPLKFKYIFKPFGFFNFEQNDSEHKIAIYKEAYCDVLNAFEYIYFLTNIFKQNDNFEAYVLNRSLFCYLNYTYWAILSPLLYTIFTFDLPMDVKELIGTYADDTTILFNSKNTVKA